jgi:glycosyltransferase involved in cell wall biosynthesis
MPIVFDNIVFSLQRAGGVSRVWSKIIEPYQGSDEVVFIEHANAANNIYRRNMSLSQPDQDHRLPVQVARYLNFSRRFLNNNFVFHSSYFRVNSAPGCINITTVHDLIYEKFGKGLGAVLHLHQKAAALRKSDCIVCVSEHTRKDLLEYYPFCMDKQIVVIPNGVEGFSKSSIKPQVLQYSDNETPAPYFLYVGHRGGCKGFNLVHDVIAMLDGALLCVVVGDPFNQNELVAINTRGYQNMIINVGKVSDSELNNLYSHASFFFFPSLYEGFGIPPLEAMMAGCPVLASNRSSVPEVVGEAGIMFDPGDLVSLKSGLSRVFQADVREDLIVLGLERVHNFSWKSVVDRYADLYSELLGNLSGVH